MSKVFSEFLRSVVLMRLRYLCSLQIDVQNYCIEISALHGFDHDTSFSAAPS